MKEFFKEYVHLIATCIIGLVFGLGFYYLLINAFHASSVSKVVYVNTNDVYYKSYQDNLNSIKKNLDKYSYSRDKFNYNISEMQRIFSEINYCYTVLNNEESIIGKSDGAFVGYADVYNLNSYYINEVLDQCYVSNLSWLLEDTIKESNVKKSFRNSQLLFDVLSTNAAYLKDELRDNSSYYYNTAVSNSMIRNDLNSSYRFVLKNYDSFSKIILELSDYLTRGDNHE